VTNGHDGSVEALLNHPVWELETDARLLDPGPGGLGRRYDVVVVGGGVIGLTTAALCQRAGLGTVAVLERGRLASGPSGRGGGILAPALHHGTDPECLVDLGRSSLALWRRLSHEWSSELGVERLDVLQTFRDGEPLASEPPPGAEVLGPEAARALEPRLAPGSGGVLVGDQARVHPLRLAAALARLAGTVATGVRVTGIEAAGSAGTRIRTDHGNLEAGAVVLATGSAPNVQGLPPASGQRLVKGTLITTIPAPFRLRVTVGGRGGLAGQLPDGRLLFGNTYDAADSSPEVRPETLAATRTDLAALIPDAGALPLSHAWCCFRSLSAGGLPVIDKVAGLEHVWATYGHFRTGFLLAAGTGRALAAWISNGERPEEITPFSASPGS
jgi:glycine/D-amino acid oxidase-like deaminating enzyme